MPQNEGSGASAKRRWLAAGLCFVLAFWLVGQLLGLLFIHQIADRAADTDGRVAIPVSVRLVGFVADRIHEKALDAPLDADQFEWPIGFRVFFFLEMCGLAGLCTAMIQLGFGILKQRPKWRSEAQTILMWSILAMISGFLFLKLID